MMKSFLLLTIILTMSLSANAQILDIPASITLPNYNGSEVTANLVIGNDDVSNNLSLDIGTLSSEKFKIKSNTCTCSLLPRRTCTVKIAFANAAQVLSSYSATDSLSVNGISVPIDVTVDALVPVVHPNFYITGSLAYGNITAPTSLTVYIENDSIKDLPLTFHFPSGLVRTGGTCGAVLLDRRFCTVTLELTPVVCAGAIYNEEFKVVTPHYKTSIPVTADFTGATSPLCIP